MPSSHLGQSKPVQFQVDTAQPSRALRTPVRASRTASAAQRVRLRLSSGLGPSRFTVGRRSAAEGLRTSSALIVLLLITRAAVLPVWKRAARELSTARKTLKSDLPR